MLSLNNVFVKYGDRVVLNRISLAIRDKDRIGLVGLNGAGKSTLLKILSASINPHEGNLVKSKDSTIGFLHQDMMLPKGKTVLEETLSILDDVKKVEKDLESINQQIEQRTDYESEDYLSLFDQLNELNEQFLTMGGDNIRIDAEKILMGLGFDVSDFQRPTEEFSGGWQMRIELTKMLLQHPDYLLLDEPTNHLDIESIIWLEQFLETYEGAVVVISHDKTFLDNVTKRTIELDSGNLYDYSANYSKYLILQEERRALQQNAYNNQQREIAHKEKLIDKFRAKANKAKMAQSLIKELKRMDKVELDDVNSAKMKLRFPPAPRSGEVVVDVKGVTKRFGALTVLDKADLQIIRGEKIAFVGKNGEGKSTLTKIILGMLDAEGHIQLGHNVSVGYYAQNQAETLDPKKTVLETIEANSPEEMRTKLRNILGSFLFSGEDVDKKVSVLSGGERARLAMACMMLRPINLLVLDEPTNHLDIRSKEVLKEAIQAYDGTMIVVSHDRDFLDGMSEKVIEFNNKQLKTYLGDVKYFLEKRAVDNFREVSLGKGNTDIDTGTKPDKNTSKEEESLKKSLKQIEQKIARTEKSIESCEQVLYDQNQFGTNDYEKAMRDHQTLKNELDRLMIQWDSIIERM